MENLQFEKDKKWFLENKVLTIGAIFTSVGLFYGLIFEASNAIISGGGSSGGGSGGNTPSNEDHFVKKGLKNIASALKAFASKALVALPGIIGTIISFSEAAVVSFFAEHLWAFGMVIALGLYQIIQKEYRLNYSKKK